MRGWEKELGNKCLLHVSAVGMRAFEQPHQQCNMQVGFYN